ncbi:MAG: YbaB/EbfC family nucleoid-associated protein [Gemmataceae bacterium]
MFDLFKNMGQMSGLLKNLPRLQEEIAQMQERLSQVVAEGDAGAGMVKIRVNGRAEVLSCSISEEALKINDREMLEDLIKAAANQALGRSREQVAEETNKLAMSMGLPPGFKLPGLG